MPGEDIAVVKCLPQELRNRRCTSNELLKHSSSTERSSEEICMLHSQVSSPHLVGLLHDSLKSLIFRPPAAIDPAIHATCFTTTVGGMKSVFDSTYDQQCGWRGISLFQRCIGCRCRGILSDLLFVYTLLVFLSCDDEPDKNLQAILEQAYLLCFEVLEGHTGDDARFMLRGARGHGFLLRKEIEQLGIDFGNIEHDQELSCEWTS